LEEEQDCEEEESAAQVPVADALPKELLQGQPQDFLHELPRVRHAELHHLQNVQLFRTIISDAHELALVLHSLIFLRCPEFVGCGLLARRVAYLVRLHCWALREQQRPTGEIQTLSTHISRPVFDSRDFFRLEQSLHIRWGTLDVADP